MTSAQGTPTLQALLAVLTLAVLSACTSVPPAAATAAAAPPAATAAPAPSVPAPAATVPSYRCDHDIVFTAQFGQDAVTVDASGRGREVLLRDAGGVTPRQTVYSNERLKAEFGLGADGNEAIVRYAEPPLVAHCTRR